MTAQQQSLEGWVPTLGPDLTLEQVIEYAFDYRGDVTVEKRDGTEVTGYLYNRDYRKARPFVQLFETETGAQVTLYVDDISNIRFTGRDMQELSHTKHIKLREKVPATGSRHPADPSDDATGAL